MVPSQHNIIVDDPDVEMTLVSDIQKDELQGLFHSADSPPARPTHLHPSATYSSTNLPTKLGYPEWEGMDGQRPAPIDTTKSAVVPPASSSGTWTPAFQVQNDSSSSSPSKSPFDSSLSSFTVNSNSDIEDRCCPTRTPGVFSIASSDLGCHSTHLPSLRHPAPPQPIMPSITGAFGPFAHARASLACFPVSRPTTSSSSDPHCSSPPHGQLEYPPSPCKLEATPTLGYPDLNIDQDSEPLHAETSFTGDTFPRESAMTPLSSQPWEKTTIANDTSADELNSYPPPPEISALLQSHVHETPVSVIMTRNCSLFPFLPAEEHGCMFLGFFIIKHVVVRISC